jgi:hypothetical protein
MNSEELKALLPKYLIERHTHKSLLSTIEQNKHINNYLNFYDPILTGVLTELLKKIDEIISPLQYNYCIYGSKVWYETFKDLMDNLSEYEQSAIHKYNSCDYNFLIKKTHRFDYADFDNKITTILESLIEYLNSQMTKTVINNKYHLLKLNKISKTKFLFQDAMVYNIELYISNDIITDVPDIKSTLVLKPVISYPHSIATVPTTALLAITSTDPDPQHQPVSTSRSQAAIKAAETRKANREAAEKERKRLAKLTEQKKSASRASRASRISSRRGKEEEKKEGGAPGEVLIKKIITFEFNFFNDISQNINYHKLFDNYNNLINTDTHFLNIYGLYIFNHIAKLRYYIERGLYNQYKIRDAIFNKFILTEDVKTKALFDILKIFELTFKDLDIPNKYLYNELQRQALISNKNIEEFVNRIETNIIESLRPSINQTIINLNNEIKKLKFIDNFSTEKSGKDLTGIYVAGGDAIRRYDYKASITKDIDTKIYLPAEISLDVANNKQIFDTCIVNNLFVLLIHLINNRDDIFSSIDPSSLHITTTNSYDASLPIEASFNLKSDIPNHMNFRFRKLLKGKFPVDLYSLDYSTTINFKYSIKYGDTPIQIDYEHKYDIAFLDVVLEESAENYYKKYSVISTNGLPISSLDFLLDDLKKTYNNDLSSLLRFQAGKIEKDYKRYLELYEIFKKNSTPETLESIYSIDKETKIITYKDDRQRTYNATLDNIANIDIKLNESDKLYNAFKTIYKNRQSNKTKIIFDYLRPSDAIMTKSSFSATLGGAFTNITRKPLIDYYQPDNEENNYYQVYKYNKINDKDADEIQKYFDAIIKPKRITISRKKLINFKQFIINKNFS